MAVIEAVPELADNGYWYHVPTITEEIPPGSGRMRTRPVMPQSHAGWCAWYMSDNTVVVRSPTPIVGVNTISLSSADKLISNNYTSRPFGRIAGK